MSSLANSANLTGELCKAMLPVAVAAVGRKHEVFASVLVGAILTLGMSPVAPAEAGTITTFFGEDDGAPVGGPFPNSSVAQTSFLAAASTFGTVSTRGFGDLPVGFQTTYTFP